MSYFPYEAKLVKMLMRFKCAYNLIKAGKINQFP